MVTKAVAVLRTIGRPDESFSGYPDEKAVVVDPHRASRQIQAIFQTLRDDGHGIRYATPLGGRVFEPARERPAGQIVRRHAEVLTRRLGTCHDLSLLIAACTEYVGIHPLVLLARGHTFIGFWRTHEARRAFWKKQRDDTSSRAWTIANGAAVQDQVNLGHIELVETTYVCQPKPYDEARTAAAKNLTEVIDDTITGFDVAIDVVMARAEGIQPV